MKKLLLLALLIFLLFNLSPVKAAPDNTGENSPPLTASQIISAINEYRQQNGLSPLKVNSTLMALAQSHSEYQAAIGSITHTGAGGTRPIDRAYAAGYGDGNKIFLSEIIYGGTSATVETAMTWWKNSSIHNHVMLDSQYLEIGAGVATADGWTYFTAELAWVTGVSAPPPSTSSGSDPTSEEPVTVYTPIEVATPLPDGSIVHIVQSGQTLIEIAAAYGVDLNVILELNGLTMDSIIYPGDRILIQMPTSGTDAVSLTPTGTLFGEGTPAPGGILGTPVSYGKTATSSSDGVPTALPTLSITSEETASPVTNPAVRWVVIIAFIIIFAVVVGSSFFQKPPERPSKDDVV